MWTFYYAPNTISLATLIALEAAGAPYQITRLDFSANEQRSAGYLKINPKGRAPSLALGDGTILTETPALLAFIAQSFPQARLAPADPVGFAKAQEFNAYLCATVHVAHSHRIRGARWANEEASFEDMRRKVPQSVREAFQVIEDHYLQGPWVLGEAWSICDAYLYTLSQWLEADGVDPGAVPRVADHRARMGELPAVRAALAKERA